MDSVTLQLLKGGLSPRSMPEETEIGVRLWPEWQRLFIGCCRWCYYITHMAPLDIFKSRPCFSPWDCNMTLPILQKKKKRQIILYCFLEPFLILCLPRKCKPYQLELTQILQWHVIFVYMRERGQRIHLPNDVLLRLTNIQITCILGILPAGKWRTHCDGGKLLSDSNRQTNRAKHLQRVPKHVQPVSQELASPLNSELANG